MSSQKASIFFRLSLLKVYFWDKYFSSMETLKTLISQGEHQRQDFKFRIDDQKKIARTLVAFANSDGGRLLIGVKDNGKIVGINPEEEFHMIQGAAEMYAKPPVKFESRIWQEEMKLVLEINVDPDANRNYKAIDEDGNWKIYIRRNDRTLLANKITLKIWSFEKQGVKKPQTFGEAQLNLLKVIGEHQKLTLSKLYRTTSLAKSTVDHTVALLVHWGLVKMEDEEEQVYYSIV